MRMFIQVYPDLAKEWSSENELGPDKISYGSNKPVIWNGSCGHTWTATPKNRGNGHGCPICSGNKVIAGLNDLVTLYPDIAKEWSSERNYPSEPQLFRPKSNRLFWWKCSKCGLEWQARIADRTDGHGCPYCLKDQIHARQKARTEAYRRENAKNWLCANTNAKMVRIIPQKMKAFTSCKCVRVKNGTADALNYAIRQAFKKIKILIDVDIVRDYDEIRRQK